MRRAVDSFGLIPANTIHVYTCMSMSILIVCAAAISPSLVGDRLIRATDSAA